MGARSFFAHELAQGLAKGLDAWHPQAMRRHWPGAFLTILIALAATFVATAYGGPQLLYALSFGLALHWLWDDPLCRPGIQFCSQTLLRCGIALLGVRITAGHLAELGLATLLVVVAGLASTIMLGVVLARVLGRPRCQGLLSGGAVGICGASAALALAAVLPPTRDNEQFTLLTVVGVTAMSTIAMVLYPLLAHALDLDPLMAGVFIGATIHDVAQAVGAGYLVSAQAGDAAIVAKLARVACLVPVIVLVAAFYRRHQHQGAAGSVAARPPLLPLFLAGFVLLMLANSAQLIGPQLGSALNAVSRACLVMAIAALGIKTSFRELAALGWRPVLMLGLETVWIAAFVLGALYWLH